MARMEGDNLAVELRPLEVLLRQMPVKQKWAEAVLARLDAVAPRPKNASVLDVGAAAGLFVAACRRLGIRCEGVEPCDEALARSMELSAHLGIDVPVVAGKTEAIPYPDDTFDIVHASSVIEHVGDVDRAVAEIHRVLKPGGVFWFSTASAMCPRQDEIHRFPLFGWYPDALKRRIMNWAKDNKPHLVNYTTTPAINWFTPRKARALLRRHGFGRVYDRWELRRPQEGNAFYGATLRLVRSTPATKFLADVLVPGCSYAAVK